MVFGFLIRVSGRHRSAQPIQHGGPLTLCHYRCLGRPAPAVNVQQDIQLRQPGGFVPQFLLLGEGFSHFGLGGCLLLIEVIQLVLHRLQPLGHLRQGVVDADQVAPWVSPQRYPVGHLAFQHKPITICVSDFDRAAPKGTGHIKAGLNYAMSLHANVTAHANGFDENLFLDPGTRTYVEETGGANFLFVTKDNEVVTPLSDSILPSITRRSLVYVAEHYLGLKVTTRKVRLDELKDFAECGLCGTAAVISPVGKVVDHGKEICFPSGMEKMGPITQKLYDTLTGIQYGKIEAPEGWIHEIM